MKKKKILERINSYEEGLNILNSKLYGLEGRVSALEEKGKPTSANHDKGNCFDRFSDPNTNKITVRVGDYIYDCVGISINKGSNIVEGEMIDYSKFKTIEEAKKGIKEHMDTIGKKVDEELEAIISRGMYSNSDKNVGNLKYARVEKVDEQLLDETMRLYRESNEKNEDEKLKEAIYNKYCRLVGSRPLIKIIGEMMEEYHKQTMILICQ